MNGYKNLMLTHQNLVVRYRSQYTLAPPKGQLWVRFPQGVPQASIFIGAFFFYEWI